MFELLFRLVFKLITKLFNLLIFPLVSVLTALFPSLDTLYNSVTTFLSNNVLLYINCGLDLLLIPTELFYLLLDYYVVIFTIQVSVSVYKLVLNVYNKLKP